MKIISISQGSPEWLEYRKSKITASDVATIMDMNPFKSPYKLFNEQMGTHTPFINDAMRRGSLLESEARMRVNMELECDYHPICAEHEVNDWLFASFDGYDPEAEIPIIEIKCPGVDTHRIACDDKVPTLYYPQIQTQMYIAGVQSAYYVSYNPEDLIPLAIVLVNRDHEFIERMLKETRAFYLRRINFLPPEPSERDKEPVVINDLNLINMSFARSTIKKELDRLQKRLDEIDSELKANCKGETSIIGNLKITKSLRKGCVDYDKIPELKTVDLDKYRKEAKETWTIREV